MAQPLRIPELPLPQQQKNTDLLNRFLQFAELMGQLKARQTQQDLAKQQIETAKSEQQLQREKFEQEKKMKGFELRRQDREEAARNYYVELSKNQPPSLDTAVNIYQQMRVLYPDTDVTNNLKNQISDYGKIIEKVNPDVALQLYQMIGAVPKDLKEAPRVSLDNIPQVGLVKTKTSPLTGEIIGKPEVVLPAPKFFDLAPGARLFQATPEGEARQIAAVPLPPRIGDGMEIQRKLQLAELAREGDMIASNLKGIGAQIAKTKDTMNRLAILKEKPRDESAMAFLLNTNPDFATKLNGYLENNNREGYKKAIDSAIATYQQSLQSLTEQSQHWNDMMGKNLNDRRAMVGLPSIANFSPQIGGPSDVGTGLGGIGDIIRLIGSMGNVLGQPGVVPTGTGQGGVIGAIQDYEKIYGKPEETASSTNQTEYPKASIGLKYYGR